MKISHTKVTIEQTNLILERICMADLVEVEELSSTERGSGGFGSTGISS